MRVAVKLNSQSSRFTISQTRASSFVCPILLIFKMANSTHTPRKALPPFKVVLLGNSGVGKSNLLSMLNSGEFSHTFKSTVGVEFLTKQLDINGTIVKAQIWDTAGQERFSSMMGTYYRKAKGAMLVYDISKKDTLPAAGRWKNELLNHAIKEDIVMVLAGNKCDLSDDHRQISKEEGAAFASKHGMEFFETSTKEDINVRKSFTKLMVGIYHNLCRVEEEPLNTHNKITLMGDEALGDSGKKGCC